jgi:hypothetical protein
MYLTSVIAVVLCTGLMLRYLLETARTVSRKRRPAADAAYLVYAAIIAGYSASALAESQARADTVLFGAGTCAGVLLAVGLIAVRLRQAVNRASAQSAPTPGI